MSSICVHRTLRPRISPRRITVASLSTLGVVGMSKFDLLLMKAMLEDADEISDKVRDIKGSNCILYVGTIYLENENGDPVARIYADDEGTYQYEECDHDGR